LNQSVVRRLGLIVLLSATLAGCGRKGPLELPPNAAATPPAQPTSAPVVSRVSPAEDNPGLIQPPTKYVDQPASEKLDQAARKPAPAINAPPAAATKAFILDPLL
jgi:predicted small lipoprotein YifL